LSSFRETYQSYKPRKKRRRLKNDKLQSNGSFMGSLIFGGSDSCLCHRQHRSKGNCVSWTCGNLASNSSLAKSKRRNLWLKQVVDPKINPVRASTLIGAGSLGM